MLDVSRWCGAVLSAALVSSLGSLAYAQDQDLDGTVDDSDTFPCDPRYSALAFAPAEGTHGTLIFEDLWPGANDHDYNDLVLGYNYVYYLDAQSRVVRMVATYTPRALGAEENMGLGLHLPVPASAVASVTRTLGGGETEALTVSTLDAEFTVDLSSNLREAFGGTGGVINANPSALRQDPQSYVVDVVFSTPQALFSSSAPHDVFIFHSDNRGHELHRSMFPGTARMDQSIFGSGHDQSYPGWWFVDHTRIPSAIDLPDEVEYPAEAVDIMALFPRIETWAYNGGTIDQDFYVNGVVSQYAYRDSAGRTAPAAGRAHRPSIDFACVATPVITQTSVTIDDSNIDTIQGSDWTVPNGVTVTIAYQGTLRLHALDLAGTIQPAGCSTGACTTLDIEVASNATIQPTGRINARGLGYLGSRQSGNGNRGRTRGNVYVSADYYTGGSHGGYGGRYGTTVPAVYDSADHPRLPGAGGTSHNTTDSRYRAGNGGGAIRLSVVGRLTVDGEIDADGARGNVYDAGGAGGSIWIDAGELASNSSGVRVHANGAYGYYAGGGGGRVAIYGAPVDGYGIDETTVTALGGAASTGGAYYAGSGTVVHGLDQEGQARLLVFANSGYNSRFGDVRLGAFGTVSSVSGNVLNTNAPLEPDTLAGRTLVPDAEGTASLSIVSNTANSITVAGDLGSVTAAGRSFYVRDYETTYRSVRIAGHVAADTGLLAVGETLSVEGATTLDIYDIEADTFSASGSSQTSVYDVAVRSFESAGSTVITARNMDFTTAELAGTSQVQSWYPTTSRVYPLSLTGRDLTVGATARLQVDGRGYLGSRQNGNGNRGRTHGNVYTGADYYTGGSHGGHGGRYGTNVTASYGDLYAPTTAGTGGTSHNTTDSRYRAGNGGGVLRIVLTGTLQNEGRISADGARGNVYDAGGAGGSIWITTEGFARSSTGVGLHANGAYGYYAGGGGGRIKIDYGSFTGWAVAPTTVSTYGGAASTGGAYYAGPGTIVYRSSEEAYGHLLVHSANGYRSRFSDTLVGPANFDDVTIVGDSHVDVPNLLVGGTFTLQDSSTVDMTTVQADNLVLAGTAHLYGQDVVATQADLQGSARATLWNVNATRLVLGGTTIITGWAPTTANIYPLYVVAGDLQLGASSRIHVDGLGYLGSRQSGNGNRGRTNGNVYTGADYYTGGSHGGYGGRYGTNVSAQYGDLLQPVTAGTGGTSHNTTDSRYRAGNGGGVLRIDVTRTFDLDGYISANGVRGNVYDAGGAGGSVWVNAGTIATQSNGSRVQASGAYGYYAGGGGGRIALYYDRLDGWAVNSTTVQANGGAASTGGAYYAGSGTIVYQPNANARPSLLVTAPNGYRSRFGRTRIGEFGTVASVSGGVLTSNQAMRPGVLAGLTLVPNAESPGATFTIVDNTASTITVQGDLSGATSAGAAWYVADYASEFEDVRVEGDVSIETGTLDVANLLRVQDSADVVASNIDALTFEQANSALSTWRSLGYQDATMSGSTRMTTRFLNGTSLTLGGTSIVTTFGSSTSMVYPLYVVSTNLTVGSSARIDVSGLGYLGSRQNGNGNRGRTDGNVYVDASFYTGGSHGGMGGRYGTTVTPTYGNPDQPVTFGAGGTSHNTTDSRYRAGTGGGVIRIDVPGTLTNDGQILANGMRGNVYDAGSAGGSLWVTAGTLDGTGNFHANGSYGYYAGGGGGRVAVYASAGGWSATSSNLQATAGAASTGGAYNGHPGTTRFN